MHRTQPLPDRALADADAGAPRPPAPPPARGLRSPSPLPAGARRGRGPHRAGGARPGERGQGTVEYVALVLLVAGVLAAAVGTAGQGFRPGELAKTVSAKISESIGAVGGRAPATTGGGPGRSGR